MFRRRPPAPTEIHFSAAQRPLLLCCACDQPANPNNAAVTGMLGVGRIRVYLCDSCEARRREKLAEYSFKKGGNK